LLVFAALPPVWDFATSGLDSALGVAWLGASWWALCGRVYPGARGADLDPATTTPWGTCVLIGLGPLVRPDLGLATVAFLAVLLFSETSWRARGRVVAWALALPIVYELFRMAYYAAIVPNSALAKEAGASEWSRGWDYFVDFVEPYYLWIPLVLLVPLGFIPLVQRAWTRASRLDAILLAAPVAAGLAQAAYVIRVGGDFMHARMLLPALFCLLLPVSVVVVRGWRWALALLIAPWVLICAVAIRHTGSEPRVLGEGTVLVTGIVNERDFYVRFSGERHPVTIDDFYGAPPPLDWAAVGLQTRRRVENGERGLLLNPFNPADGPRPLDDHVVDTPIVSFVRTLGLYSYAAGPDVFVVDELGLATAIGSHFRRPALGGTLGAEYERAGHDKPHRAGWEVARFGARTPAEPRDVREARRSLSCGEAPELLDAVTAKYGPGRAWENFRDSFTLTRFRIPENPSAAVRDLCGNSRARQPVLRTSAPGLAPVSRPSRMTTSPLTIVAS
jgi:arabinofuranosyltransferase